MRLFELVGKNVVITGAARGIGREAAIIMSQKGASVFVLDIDCDLISQMQSEYPAITYIRADVSNQDSIAEAFAGIGKIDVLVNNAGVQKENAFEDIELDEWRRTIDVNLTGTFICIQTALKYMGGGSTILNVLTHEGRRTNLYPYAASKAAIKNLTQNLVIALSNRDISINGLAFGAVYSERNSHWQHDPEKVQKAFDRTPLKFMLEPCEVAYQMVNFIENSSRYATGTVFDVSGGRSLT